MLPLRDLRFQGPEGTFSKTKASQTFTMHTPEQTSGLQGALQAVPSHQLRYYTEGAAEHVFPVQNRIFSIFWPFFRGLCQAR